MASYSCDSERKRVLPGSDDSVANAMMWSLELAVTWVPGMKRIVSTLKDGAIAQRSFHLDFRQPFLGINSTRTELGSPLPPPAVVLLVRTTCLAE